MFKKLTLSLKKFKDVVTIIAPRHIHRIDEIKNLSKKFELNFQILNQNEIIEKDKEIIIINYFGALKNYFKYAKSVFMGKSIIKKFKYNGGQNPIEAAKQNCKIYYGPFVNNFSEIYKILDDNNISKQVNNFEELSGNLLVDLEEPKKKENFLNPIENLTQKFFLIQ